MDEEGLNIEGGIDIDDVDKNCRLRVNIGVHSHVCCKASVSKIYTNDITIKSRLISEQLRGICNEYSYILRVGWPQFNGVDATTFISSVIDDVMKGHAAINEVTKGDHSIWLSFCLSIEERAPIIKLPASAMAILSDINVEIDITSEYY